MKTVGVALTPLAVAYFHISLILHDVLCTSVEESYSPAIVSSTKPNSVATYPDHHVSKSSCEVLVMPRMVFCIEKEKSLYWSWRAH